MTHLFLSQRIFNADDLDAFNNMNRFDSLKNKRLYHILHTYVLCSLKKYFEKVSSQINQSNFIRCLLLNLVSSYRKRDSALKFSHKISQALDSYVIQGNKWICNKSVRMLQEGVFSTLTSRERRFHHLYEMLRRESESFALNKIRKQPTQKPV